jgi:adenylate kinase family enzyme
LENEISENEIDLSRKEKEKENTQEIITSNGLVDKQATIEKLDKELASLKTKNERMHVKSDRERNSIQKNQGVIHTTEDRVIQLKSEKQQLTGERNQAARDFN